MTTHALIGRLGKADTLAIKPTVRGATVSEIDLILDRRNLAAGLGQPVVQLKGLGLKPTETAIDLLILAALVYAADTRISRNLNAQDRWTREIELIIPVSNPSLWENQAALIRYALNFLTGDRWILKFRARPSRMAKLAPTPDRLPLGGHDSVCLFSGGLDSYIGAIDLLKGKASPIFVSHWWDSVTSDHQKHCIERLSKRFRLDPAHIRARVGFSTDLIGENNQENSLRGRSFMFFGLAALAASALGKTTIYVPENGLISLNVPLDPSRLGALSTRTTHPFYMARWQELLTGLGIEATIVNPYRFQTKGEMVENCLDKDFLRKTAGETMSCAHPDSVRWSGGCPKHCGHCVPCLIRRAALTRGLASDPTKYHLQDLHAQVLDADKAEGEHVRAFLVALSRLERSPNSARFAIHQPGPLRDFPGDWDRYRDVYVNGLREVSNILSGVVARPL